MLPSKAFAFFVSPSKFKYFAKKEIGDSVPDPSQLTKSDGSLELNVGRINVVFLYRFINDLLVSFIFHFSCANKLIKNLHKKSQQEGHNRVRSSSPIPFHYYKYPFPSLPFTFPFPFPPQTPSPYSSIYMSS